MITMYCFHIVFINGNGLEKPPFYFQQPILAESLTMIDDWYHILLSGNTATE